LDELQLLVFVFRPQYVPCTMQDGWEAMDGKRWMGSNGWEAINQGRDEWEA